MKNIASLLLLSATLTASSFASATCETVYNNDTHQEEQVCHDDPPARDSSGEQSSCEVVYDYSTGSETTICH